MLANQLLDSLDELDEKEWEESWLREAERPKEQLTRGEVPAIPSEQVHRRLEARLQGPVALGGVLAAPELEGDPVAEVLDELRQERARRFDSQEF